MNRMRRTVNGECIMKSSTRWCARHTLHVIAIVSMLFTCGQALAGQTLAVDMRTRVALPDAPGRFSVACEKQQWDPCDTAIIICDMWDKHWCKGASERTAELAPLMNRVVS